MGKVQIELKEPVSEASAPVPLFKDLHEFLQPATGDGEDHLVVPRPGPLPVPGIGEGDAELVLQEGGDRAVDAGIDAVEDAGEGAPTTAFTMPQRWLILAASA